MVQPAGFVNPIYQPLLQDTSQDTNEHVYTNPIVQPYTHLRLFWILSVTSLFFVLPLGFFSLYDHYQARRWYSSHNNLDINQNRQHYMYIKDGNWHIQRSYKMALLSIILGTCLYVFILYSFA